MIRRNVISGTGVSTTGGTTNQENPIFRQKHVVDSSIAPAPRPPMRFALGEINKNTQQQQPMLKKSTSLKAGKAENPAITKVEPRRPLRSNTLSNVPAPNATKHVAVEPKVTRAVASRMTSVSSSTIGEDSSTLTSNASKFLTAAAQPKPRLLRSNAVSSLHAAATSVCDSAIDETSELVSMQAALCLAPVKEDVETVVSPNRQNAYSSGMASMLPNIDKGDEGNPQCAAEYVNDIYDYLRALENQQTIKDNFLEGKDITGRMRSILVDWLSQVHVRFHLLPETLYMTVSIIDRFLQDVVIPKEKLQLLGVTAMFIASKYEEMYAPEIADFVYITDNSVSKHDIRVMECLVLRALKFKLGRPLPIHFLRRYSKAADADTTLHTMSKYFLELSMVQYQLSHFRPSILAASALWLALKLLKPDAEWNDTLKYYSKYDEEDFQTCFRRLCRCVIRMHDDGNKQQQQAIRNKFSTSKFFEISTHPCLNLTVIRQLCGEL